MKSMNTTRENGELIRQGGIKTNRAFECRAFFYHRENSKALVLIIYDEVLKEK